MLLQSFPLNYHTKPSGTRVGGTDLTNTNPAGILANITNSNRRYSRVALTVSALAADRAVNISGTMATVTSTSPALTINTPTRTLYTGRHVPSNIADVVYGLQNRLVKGWESAATREEYLSMLPGSFSNNIMQSYGFLNFLNVHDNCTITLTIYGFR